MMLSGAVYPFFRAVFQSLLTSNHVNKNDYTHYAQMEHLKYTTKTYLPRLAQKMRYYIGTQKYGHYKMKKGGFTNSFLSVSNDLFAFCVRPTGAHSLPAMGQTTRQTYGGGPRSVAQP